MSYDTTKHKINTLFNQTNRIDDKIIELESKQIDTNKKLDTNIINFINSTILHDSGWITIDYEGLAIQTYSFSLKINKFPGRLIPFLKAIVYYRFPQSGYSNRGYIYIDNVNKNEDVSNQEVALEVVRFVEGATEVRFVVELTNPIILE